MKILGFHNDIDAGAALLVDSCIVGAVNEERFSRQKLHEGFPYESIQYLLDVGGFDLADIDCFVYGWFEGANAFEVMPTIAARAMLSADEPGAKEIIADRLHSEYENDLKTKLDALSVCDELGIPREKICFSEHHKGHAWSAFSTSPYDKAMVVTADGRGDYKSLTVSVADQNGIVEVDWLSTLDSLGYLYSRITHYLGYQPFRHEGKITGLAAYGDPAMTIELMDRMITWRDDRIYSRLGDWFKPFPDQFTDVASDALAKHTPEDIAAGLQAHVEDLLVKFVTTNLQQHPNENVCLAGGLFANVKINQKVFEIDGVRNIYVQPNMGDGGLALGGALMFNHTLTGDTKVPMPDAYLGPSYDNQDVLVALKNEVGIRYQLVEDKPRLVSQAIQNNKVVGYFDGAMEFGPRSLGHRSILYHPKDQTINDWLNKRLQRTEFMPFAPVVAVDLAHKCFIGWEEDHIAAQFMTVTYNCTEEFANNCPAVCHIDNTARPQITSPVLDGSYYSVVKQYYEDTGTLSLINTSFNQHEEPIVCSPKDAISGLLNGMVDVLFIEGYMVEKA